MLFELRRVGVSVALADSSSARLLVRSRAGSDPDRLAIQAKTFAEGCDGRRVSPEHPDIHVTLWRHGIRAIWKCYTGPALPTGQQDKRRALESYRLQLQDIEDAVNQLLGRDPEQESPPRLSWSSLVQALRDEGISVSEETLLDAPFDFEFSDEILAVIL